MTSTATEGRLPAQQDAVAMSMAATAAPSVGEAADSARVRTGRFSVNWLVGRRYDLFFFIGSCAVTWVFLGIYHGLEHYGFGLEPQNILLTYLIFTALFDQPHIFQTFSRTHADRDAFARHKTAHTWGLLAFIAVGFVIAAMKWSGYLVVFAAIFGSWHIVRQHWGILRAYKAVNRDRSAIDDWLDFATFYIGAAAFYLYDYTDNPPETVIYGDLKASFPNLPAELGQFTLYVFWVVLAAFVARQAWRLATGLPVNLPKLLFMAAALGTHGMVFYFTATPFLVAEALETSYHDVQYQGWMRNYQRKRFAAKRVARRWLVMAFTYGIVVGSLEVLALASPVWGWLFVPFGMTVLWHYWVEGRIWKLGKQPELKAVLARSK